MIVPMRRVFIAAAARNREDLLEVLADLGVMEIEPVEEAKSAGLEEAETTFGQTIRAIQILQGVPGEEHGESEEEKAKSGEIVREVLELEKESAELEQGLTELGREARRETYWGDIDQGQIEELKEAGLDLIVARVSPEELEELPFEHLQVLEKSSKDLWVVAGVTLKGDEVELPDEIEFLKPPQRSLEEIRKKAGKLEERRDRIADRFEELKSFLPDLRDYREDLAWQVEMAKAKVAGRTEEELFAVQGWVEEEAAGNLDQRIAERGLDAAVRSRKPTEEEQPPTSLRHPAWIRPIQGLFEILGSVPGYREIDVSSFFMIALPIFAGLLIGDAGYGLLFILAALLMPKRWRRAAGRQKIQLFAIVGAASFLIGMLEGNYFGLTPETFGRKGIGATMEAVAPLWDPSDSRVRDLLIQLSLVLGVVHLTSARIRQGLDFAPHPRALAEAGWVIFLWAIFSVIWLLFYKSVPVPVEALIAGAAIGAILFTLFTYPEKPWPKRIGFGFGASLFPMLNTFSDTISYIRLMAVGIATYYIASSFNQLSSQIAEVATWFAATPVLVFGHLLNIGLVLVAIFAHGVRLNMLEFSNNAGVRWKGRPFQPFARHRT